MKDDKTKQSDQFIVYELSGYEYDELQKLYETYKYLTSDSRDSEMRQLNKDDVSFCYNTLTKVGNLKVRFTDCNQHTHSLKLSVSPKRSIHLSVYYTFEGKFKRKPYKRRLFTELLMTELFKMGYDVEPMPTESENSLIIEIRYYSIFRSIVQIVRLLIESQVPVEWYYEKKDLWYYPNTYYDLILMLPKLRREAENNRWKDVRPENFVLHTGKEYTMLHLDYEEPGLYEMSFRIGCKKDSFCAPAYDKYIDCSYVFTPLSGNIEVYEYYKEQNIEFCKLTNLMLSAVCNWKSLFFHSDDGLYISVERPLGFQKFCLMLDVALALKNDFKPEKPLITTNMNRQKKELEASLGVPLEFAEEDNDKLIFTNGHFKTDQGDGSYKKFDDDISDDIECPF